MENGLLQAQSVILRSRAEYIKLCYSRKLRFGLYEVLFNDFNRNNVFYVICQYFIAERNPLALSIISIGQ